eukprot:TRINITY_DN10188_c0_g1_i2.p1 TRINITY_DN10188_c0_g1~~TRINITY_DN10188_c0_g1_i2.p1  ORF type:complete len:630 (+),score=107.24 TRINITY_DN10188_c0_g1_i2:2-1891(+)
MVWAVATMSSFFWLCVQSKQPHIIMVIQDDLGRHDMMFDGGDSTPSITGNVSAMARDGIILNRMHTHWHCSPTRRSFLSGRLPIHHGEQLSAIGTDDIDLRWTWISSKLKRVGYETHWYGKGHTGYVSWHHLAVNNGFDNYYGYLGGAQSYTSTDRWNNTQPSSIPTYSSQLYGDMAISAVKNHNTSKPFFMYLAWQAVHTPYDPVPDWNKSIYCKGYTEQAEQSTYCGMLWDSDVYMGRLRIELERNDMWNDTLIVFVSDNGGVGSGINYPLRGEKHSNWQGGMQVAAFVSGGLVPPELRGTSSNLTAHVVDMYPTFCNLAGADPHDDPPVPPLPVELANTSKDIYGNESYPSLDGVDIWPYLTNPDLVGNNISVAHPYLVLTKEVILAGNYKLLVSQPNFKTQNNGWKYPNGSWVESDDADWPCSKQDGERTQILPGIPGQLPCLFNLVEDEREMRNIAHDNLELVQSLWRKLNETVLTTFHHGSSGPDGNPGNIERCSPPDLIGPCNATCAAAFFHETASEQARCSLSILQNTCLEHSELDRRLNLTTVAACCQACQADSDCQGFTLNLQQHDPTPCHLKSEVDASKRTPGATCTSGIDGPIPPPATSCAHSSKSFPVCGIPGCEA